MNNFDNDIKKKREERKIAKQKERRILIIKKMIPHCLVALLVLVMISICNILSRPFLTDKNTFLYQGVCISIEQEWTSENKKRWCVYNITLDNSDNYQVRQQDIAGFKSEEFINAKENKVFNVKYGVNLFTKEKYIVDIQDIYGKQYLELKDVNSQVLLEWGLSYFVYVIYASLYLLIVYARVRQ